MHFSLEIWQLVATILIILLRINCPNFVQFSIQLDVLRNGVAWYVVKCRLYSVINHNMSDASALLTVVGELRSPSQFFY